jgi:hypothetical protein
MTGLGLPVPPSLAGLVRSPKLQGEAEEKPFLPLIDFALL